MTADVTTSTGLRHGSAVYEVFAAKNGTRLLAEERAGAAGLFGEALMIDIPDHQPLFVMMKPVPSKGQFSPPEVYGIYTQAFRPSLRTDGIDNFLAAVQAVGKLPTGYEVALPRTSWPLMIRFGDMNDPASVYMVPPEQVGVQQVRLAITRDALSKTLSGRMPPWFLRYARQRRQLDGLSSGFITSAALAANLSFGDFSRTSSGINEP